MKNGGVAAIQEQPRIRVEQELQRRQEQKELEQAEKIKQQQKQQIQELPQQRRGSGMGR